MSTAPAAVGLVVVGGPPASGKTTLVAALAPRLGLTVLSKDTIKEALMDALPPADIDDSKRLGGASMEVLFALAAASPGAILEANWWATIAGPRIAALAGPIVEVFCRCDLQLAFQRYRTRAPDRHPGHFDSIRDLSSMYPADSCQPIAGGWPVIEVDTSRPVNVDALVEQIASSLQPADARAPSGMATKTPSKLVARPQLSASWRESTDLDPEFEGFSP